jgi:hypothetical protein
MNIPTHEEMEKVLEETLASDYPYESVENGENWQLIAEIFFRLGYDSAIKFVAEGA